VNTLYRLTHPHIVKCYGASDLYDKDDEVFPFLLVEFLPRSLATAIHGDKDLSQPLKLTIATQIAEAMAYLHSSNPRIEHRDLKPDNVMLTERNQAKIIDFGLAVSKSASKSTFRGGANKGTFKYMVSSNFVD
jgi:serine/threonine protein kinase